MPKVLNKRTDSIPKDAVFIGRPSKWGNPYHMGPGMSRSDAVKAYELYLLSNEELMRSLIELRGKDLVCFCAPQACHGDVLLKYANKMFCPYCHGSKLEYRAHVIQTDNGTWCDAGNGELFSSWEDVIQMTPVHCNECGHTFNPMEEG